MNEARGIGIRTLLLAILLPGVIGLLALDTWNDYRAISRVVTHAYDQALVEPAQALDDSVVLGDDGRPRIDAAFAVEAMFESTRPRFRELRVSYTVVPARGASPARPRDEQTLMGPVDLPTAPEAPDDVPVFYDTVYRGHPVRIAALRHTIPLSADESFRVLSQAAEGTDAREQVLSSSWHQALWNDARVVCVMVVLVWIGIALALRPLGRLRKSLAARSPDDLRPLDAGGVPYEVAPLVEAVNHHIGNQSRLLAEQSRFLADASHQLRTPIAIMLTQAGYALRERDPALMRETLRAIVAQLARARRLSDQLLALARAREDTPGSAPKRPIVDLNAVAREVVLQHLLLASEKRLDLGWSDARGDAADDIDPLDDSFAASDSSAGAPIVPVEADALELHEALSNLVDNAIKYTPAGGRITVSVQRDGAWARADVSDTGPGIPAELRAAAFERFSRGASGGSGLGLAIAHGYARRNGGRIELDDAIPADAQ
ncbi:MAG: sensor histidine kinase, partial [Gammaproteobacteria bacterium]|nr:sensor histidine kinase [Gammaproteobacteria bacterium]